MKITRPLLTVGSLLALSGTALSQNLTIDFSANLTPYSLGGLGSGQTFFPEDVTGYAGQSTLSLTELSFWSGNLGGTGHVTTYIAVYDGDPDTSTLVGSSSNFIDTSAGAGVPNYTEWLWTFDALALNAGTEYWAVMSNSPTDVNPTNTVPRSLQEYDHQGTPNDAYRGTSIIANRAPHSTSIDLRFRATFADAPGTQYCSGDGTGTLCPCNNNNNGDMGGCDWGDLAFPSGGVLTATGSASMAANDTILVAAHIENNFGIFFGAANQVNGGNGNPLNDGLRCAGGALVRLIPPTMASGNSATTPSPVQTLDTGAASGVTRRYQYWFRTPGGPCGQMANLTNGYEIAWLP